MKDKYKKILARESGKRKVLTSEFQVKSKAYTNEEIEKIIQMERLNLPIKVIADELGRSY